MTTLYGPEAKEGDYCLVAFSDRYSSTVSVYPARVSGQKAYAPATKKGTDYKRHWLRKMTAICKIDPEALTDEEKEVIEANIASESSICQNWLEIEQKCRPHFC